MNCSPCRDSPPRHDRQFHPPSARPIAPPAPENNKPPKNRPGAMGADATLHAQLTCCPRSTPHEKQEMGQRYCDCTKTKTDATASTNQPPAGRTASRTPVID